MGLATNAKQIISKTKLYENELSVCILSTEAITNYSTKNQI